MAAWRRFLVRVVVNKTEYVKTSPLRRHDTVGKAQIPLCRLPCDVRDKPVTSPLAEIHLRRLPRNFPVRGGFGEVGVMEFGLGDVTGLSRTCRGRHGEVGIVEFGL